MRVIVAGKTYDSTKVPVLIEFDENEQEMFNGMKRFVSAPEKSTKAEREVLITMNMFGEYTKNYKDIPKNG